MIKWSEHGIARAVALQTLARKCVVLVDNCNWTGHECDVLAVTTDLRIIDVEVKISRADLKADAGKEKWWHRTYGAWIPGQRRQDMTMTARQHPPKVWKHYYAMPKEIWKPELLDCLPSKASGVLLLEVGRRHHPPLVVDCTGKAITLDTDTAAQKAAKVGGYLYKAFAPNIIGLPGTYATEGVAGSMTGRTDAFGREQSTAQAVGSSFGIKLGSYPADVLRRNLNAKAQAEMMEIQKNISQLKRQRQTGRIDAADFESQVQGELAKKQKIMRELGEKLK